MGKTQVFRLICAALLISVMTGCSRQGPPADVIHDEHFDPYHIVKKGETLGQIASKYKMTRSELVSLNGLKPPYRIFSGQKLLVSMKNSPSEGSEESTSEDNDGIKAKPLTPVGANAFAKGAETSLGGAKTAANVVAAGAGTLGATMGGSDASLASDSAKSTDAKLASDEVKGNDADLSSDEVTETSKTNMQTVSSGIYKWPLKGVDSSRDIIKSFNASKGASKHEGINIAAKEGSPVLAIEDGTIGTTKNAVKGFGNVVVVQHPGGHLSVYAHLEKINVVKGKSVKAGQTLGLVGKTGLSPSAKPQLYLQIRKAGKPIDPVPLLVG